jgi:hypothetical protein
MYAALAAWVLLEATAVSNIPSLPWEQFVATKNQLHAESRGVHNTNLVKLAAELFEMLPQEDKVDTNLATSSQASSHAALLASALSHQTNFSYVYELQPFHSVLFETKQFLKAISEEQASTSGFHDGLGSELEPRATGNCAWRLFNCHDLTGHFEFGHKLAEFNLFVPADWTWGVAAAWSVAVESLTTPFYLSTHAAFGMDALLMLCSDIKTHTEAHHAVQHALQVYSTGFPYDPSLLEAATSAIALLIRRAETAEATASQRKGRHSTTSEQQMLSTATSALLTAATGWQNICDFHSLLFHSAWKRLCKKGQSCSSSVEKHHSQLLQCRPVHNAHKYSSEDLDLQAAISCTKQLHDLEEQLQLWLPLLHYSSCTSKSKTLFQLAEVAHEMNVCECHSGSNPNMVLIAQLLEASIQALEQALLLPGLLSLPAGYIAPEKVGDAWDAFCSPALSKASSVGTKAPFVRCSDIAGVFGHSSEQLGPTGGTSCAVSQFEPKGGGSARAHTKELQGTESTNATYSAASLLADEAEDVTHTSDGLLITAVLAGCMGVVKVVQAFLSADRRTSNMYNTMQSLFIPTWQGRLTELADCIKDISGAVHRLAPLQLLQAGLHASGMLTVYSSPRTVQGPTFNDNVSCPEDVDRTIRCAALLSSCQQLVAARQVGASDTGSSKSLFTLTQAELSNLQAVMLPPLKQPGDSSGSLSLVQAAIARLSYKSEHSSAVEAADQAIAGTEVRRRLPPQWQSALQSAASQSAASIRSQLVAANASLVPTLIYHTALQLADTTVIGLYPAADDSSYVRIFKCSARFALWFEDGSQCSVARNSRCVQAVTLAARFYQAVQSMAAARGAWKRLSHSQQGATFFAFCLCSCRLAWVRGNAEAAAGAMRSLAKIIQHANSSKAADVVDEPSGLPLSCRACISVADIAASSAELQRIAIALKQHSRA